MSVVEEGYKLPFFSFPEPAAFKSNRSALEHAEFLESALEVLCQSGRVIWGAMPPYVINPLSVSVQAKGKKRLILDLIHQQVFAEETYKIRGLESGYFIF